MHVELALHNGTICIVTLSQVVFVIEVGSVKTFTCVVCVNVNSYMKEDNGTLVCFIMTECAAHKCQKRAE